jgi:hypothetical protein
VWLKLTQEEICFIRPMGDCFCQVSQVQAHLWRWEVRRWHDRTGRFDLERLGTQPALAQALAAAESYAETSQPAAPS